MNYTKITQKMSDGAEITIHRWLPDGEVKGIVHLSHGMAEHAFRYDEFGRLLTKNGIALIGEDHRGHGETAAAAEKNGTGKFGYIADENGFFRIVEDLHEENESIRKEFPGKKIILFGHSFGSFLSQCYCEKYSSTIDGCILCGTAGPRLGLMKLGKIVASVVKLFKGAKKESPLLNAMAFGAYNKNYNPKRTDFDWLSRDFNQVDRYIADPWCGFLCTTGFFLDMFTGLSWIHQPKNMKAIPSDLPVHLIDGTDDPVGDYSKTVKELFEIYRANGMKNVDLKLYPEARHELLNETNREEIADELLSWVNNHIQ